MEEIIYTGLDLNISRNIDDFNYIKYDEIPYSESNQQKLLQYYASKHKSDSFIKCVELHPIDLNFGSNILAKLAVTYNSDKILEYLIQSGLDISCCDNYLIKCAAHNGNCYSKDILQILIQNGADICTDNNYPIKVAVKHSMYHNVQTLIESGVDPTFNNNEIFDYVFTSINSCYTYCTLKMLIENGVDPSINCSKLLNNVVSSGISGMLEILIKYGVDLNLVEPDSIITCLKHNNSDLVIKILIDNGFDFNFLNEYSLNTVGNSPRFNIYLMLTNNGVNSLSLMQILLNQ